jgi:hypothetical protein
MSKQPSDTEVLGDDWLAKRQGKVGGRIGVLHLATAPIVGTYLCAAGCRRWQVQVCMWVESMAALQEHHQHRSSIAASAPPHCPLTVHTHPQWHSLNCNASSPRPPYSTSQPHLLL